MVKGTKEYLLYLIIKSEDHTISAGEQKLLDDFIQYEFDHSSWDEKEMGPKDRISAALEKAGLKLKLNKHNK